VLINLPYSALLKN